MSISRGSRKFLPKAVPNGGESITSGRLDVEPHNAGPITRRNLLIGAGAAVSLTLLSPKGTSAEVVEYAEDPGKWVAGVVKSIELPDSLLIHGFRDPQTEETKIEFIGEATFWRDRPVTLTAFEPGDEVFVEGRWTDDVFTASSLESLWRALEGRIVGKNKDQLQTSGGVIRLISETRFSDGEDLTDVPMGQLTDGKEIWATGRFDRTTGEIVAQKIGMG